MRVVLRDIRPAMEGMVNRYAPGRRGADLREARSHRHDELELNLVVQGQVSYLLEGRHYRLSRGSLLWLFPGQEHLLIEQSPSLVMWVAAFVPALVERVSRRLAAPEMRADAPSGYFCRLVGGVERDELDGLCRALALGTMDDAARRPGLEWLLTRAWAIFQDAVHLGELPTLAPEIGAAVHLLQDPERSWTLPELARQVDRSPAWLSRSFHRQMGMTMADFRNRQRLTRFLDAYRRDGGDTLLAAALAAGFTSYPQFSRVFRAATGVGPRTFLAGVTASALDRRADSSTRTVRAPRS